MVIAVEEELLMMIVVQEGEFISLFIMEEAHSVFSYGGGGYFGLGVLRIRS